MIKSENVLKFEKNKVMRLLKERTIERMIGRKVIERRNAGAIH